MVKIDFNYGEFAEIKSQAGFNSYKISVKQWTSKTNAIGLIAKAGRYGELLMTQIHQGGKILCSVQKLFKH